MTETANGATVAPGGTAPTGAGQPHRRATGIALMLTSSSANQVGAAMGALAFPTIGPVGVVAVRQLVTAAVLVPLVRPPFRSLARADWVPVVGLAIVFSMMNMCLYAAIDRIGLGLAVTLEFLGPLAVAIGTARRRIDLGCAAIAAVGVVVLIHPGPSTDVIGIALGMIAAVAWASYILLNRTIGARLPGLHGTAVASAVTAGLWLPIAVFWFAGHPPTIGAIALAAACALGSSIIPYVADLQALRWVPTPIFATFTSVNPVWAAIAGLLVLDQRLGWYEWTGIALIVVANVVVSLYRGRPQEQTSTTS